MKINKKYKETQILVLELVDLKNELNKQINGMNLFLNS